MGQRRDDGGRADIDGADDDPLLRHIHGKERAVEAQHREPPQTHPGRVAHGAADGQDVPQRDPRPQQPGGGSADVIGVFFSGPGARAGSVGQQTPPPAFGPVATGLQAAPRRDGDDPADRRR